MTFKQLLGEAESDEEYFSQKPMKKPSIISELANSKRTILSKHQIAQLAKVDIV